MLTVEMPDQRLERTVRRLGPCATADFGDRAPALPWTRRRAHQSFFVAVLTLFGVLGGCDASVNPANSPATDTRVLTKTLATLNLADPVADLDAHLSHGDLRFVGISGYICVAPGVDGQEANLVQKYGLRCLEGTSEAIGNSEPSALLKKAQSYAAAYNAELLRRIHSGSAT
jgi:hypothetical protein